MVLFRLAHRAMMGFIDYEPEGSSCYDNEDIFEAVDKLNNKISGLVDRYIVRGDTYFAGKQLMETFSSAHNYLIILTALVGQMARIRSA